MENIWNKYLSYTTIFFMFESNKIFKQFLFKVYRQACLLSALFKEDAFAVVGNFEEMEKQMALRRFLHAGGSTCKLQTATACGIASAHSLQQYPHLHLSEGFLSCAHFKRTSWMNRAFPFLHNR